MFRKVLLAIAFLVAIVAVLGGVKYVQFRSMIQAGKSFKMPPETVSSTRVRRASWETTLGAVGTVTAVQGTVLETEVAGIVKTISFESGAVARKGQVLVELERSAEEAQLQSALARAELARANLARARDLHAQDLVAQADLDAAEAAAQQTASDVSGFRVAVDKKIIRAPFDGRLGIRQVQLGQFADIGTPIVPLQSLDPVHVDFSLPEQAAQRLKAGMTVRARSDAASNSAFEGTLTAVDPLVDPASRNIKLQATFQGTGGALLPGMFVHVAVVLPETQSVLVVPVIAVQFAPYGDAVFVISDVKDETTGAVTKTVRMTTVKLGETRGDLVAVETGVEEGQEIATSGVFKLHNGSEVAINNELAPEADEAPQPKDS